MRFSEAHKLKRKRIWGYRANIDAQRSISGSHGGLVFCKSSGWAVYLLAGMLTILEIGELGLLWR